MKSILLCLLFLGALSGFGLGRLSASPHSQGLGVISGTVENGTLGATVPEGLEVKLESEAGGDALVSRTAIVSPDGRFEFRDVPVGEVVLYIVSTEYAGVSYQSVVHISLLPVELPIYENTSSTVSLRFLGHTMVVNRAEKGKEVLEVFDLVSLENTGDRTIVPDLGATEGMADLLRFSLPAGARELDVASDLQGGTFVQVEKGFALTSLVTPGRHEVSFSYELPYKGSTADLGRTFPFGSGVFRLLVPEDLGEVRSGQLRSREGVSLGERFYRVLESEPLEPSQVLALSVEGLPRRSLAHRWWDASLGGLTSVAGIPALLGIALLALLVYAFLRAKPTPHSRQALVQTIAQLDNSFERQQISESEYRLRRQELKTLLLQVASREQVSST